MSLFDRIALWWQGRAASRKRIPSSLGPGVVIDDLPLFHQVSRIGGSLTPDEVTAAIRSADIGTMWPLVSLVNDARRKDGHLQAILGTREMALPSLGWEVTTRSKRRKDRKVAEWVTEALALATGANLDDANLVGLRRMLAHMQGAVTHGYALAECVYERAEGKLWPTGWNLIHATRVQFDQDTGRPCWFDQSAGMAFPGVDLRSDFAPGKIIFYQPRVTGDEPTKEGLGRVLLWAALFRNWSLRDWIALGELAWKPWRIGTYEPDADDKAIANLKAVLRSLTSSGTALLPARTDLKVEWPAGNKQDASHQGLMAFLAGEMSKSVLGQTLTTEAGDKGARALGQVHDLIRRDILEFDATSVAETLRRDLIAPLVRRNFGMDADVPDFRFLTEETVDLVNFANGVTSLVDGGLRVPASWVYDRTGIPQPKDGEECLGDSLAPGEVDVPIDEATGLPAEPSPPPPDTAPEE